MQYVVLDLEWNQPTSYSSYAYKEVGGKLMFELIQIGAVKVDEYLNVIDSFSQFIHPVHYTKLNPRIRRITHIEQEDLEDAPEFCEAMQSFSKWCGDDYVMLTWGCDDISVLYQNMTFFKCDVQLKPMYDLQRLYGEIVGGNSKDRKGLKAAMEQMNISPDEDSRPFHNAVNDAYYTALIFSTFPEPEKVFNYPLAPKKLQHIERKKECQIIVKIKNAQDGMHSVAATNPNCPVCGKKLELSEGYVKQKDGSLVALCECAQHGLIFSRLRFSKNDDGKAIMIRGTQLSEEQSKAYVSTKHLQWRRKLEIQEETEHN